MKRFLICCVMGTMLQMTTAFGAEAIHVTVNDAPLALDPPPTILEDRTLVPLRGIFEALGAQVQWIPDTKTIVAQKDSDVVTMQIDHPVLYRNETQTVLDVSPCILQERTYIPVRAVAEAFRAEVSWDAETKTVLIQTVETENTDNNTVQNRHIIQEKTQEDGTILYTLDYAYPELPNPTQEAQIATMNQILKQSAQCNADAFETKYLEDAKQDMEKLGNQFTSYTSTQKYVMTYYKENVLSVVDTITSNVGQDEKLVSRISQTYDCKTGQSLTPSDLFEDGEQQWKKAVLNSFLTVIKEHPQDFNPDAEQILQEKIKDVGFYLTEDGIVFYLNPNIIAPADKGIIQFMVEMPYQKK